MASKAKDTRLNQKAYWEKKLSARLAGMTEKGVEADKIKKDATLKKIRAKLRETDARLQAIEALEKQLESKAQLKAEKAAGPKKDKGKKKKESEATAEVSKRQQKKKKKQESKSQSSES
jgi:hypothetical protein